MLLLGMMSVIAVSHLHQGSPALDAAVLLAGFQARSLPLFPLLPPPPPPPFPPNPSIRAFNIGHHGKS